MDKTCSALLLASFLFWFPPSAMAQHKPPLKCGTDLEGGIPYLFGNKDDPIGFEVELMNALARELDRPIERQHAEFSSLIPTLARGDVDLAINGLEITPENLRQARF